MLAYSSVAQIGYMVLGISLGSVAGLTGGIVHMANHALMKTMLAQLPLDAKERQMLLDIDRVYVPILK